MEATINRYEKKMIAQGLVEAGAALMAEMETDIIWNRDDPHCGLLTDVFDQLNITSLCFSQPAEPYRSIIEHLATGTDSIKLEDNETRLFLHDLPVVHGLDPLAIVEQLKRRKAAIIPGHGIITHGTVTMEQCFVVFSSVLFSCFVKYFTDYLRKAKKGKLPEAERGVFENVIQQLAPAEIDIAELQKGPFAIESDVYQAISEVGKPVVGNGLVDSVMGNVSYRFNNALYISQTGSFLDELEGCIDPCPLDNSACTGITASTELPAHIRIVNETPFRAILHGHPKFAVIMSLACEKTDCEFKDLCYTKCPEERHIHGVPIVPGESGSGPNALCHTVPKALAANRGVIVYGHGVFTADENDFNRPYRDLIDIENRSRDHYFEQLQLAGITV